MSDRIDAEEERWFPNLVKQGYRKTSEPTPKYNCIAYAFGFEDQWWEPGNNEPWHIWPDGLTSDQDFENYVMAAKSLGFIECKDEMIESGFEKIALYIAQNGTGSHAAKQLPNGKWSSKLGESADIEHNTLKALEGQFGYIGYWKVKQLMKRPIKHAKNRGKR